MLIMFFQTIKFRQKYFRDDALIAKTRIVFSSDCVRPFHSKYLNLTLNYFANYKDMMMMMMMMAVVMDSFCGILDRRKRKLNMYCTSSLLKRSQDGNVNVKHDSSG